VFGNSNDCFHQHIATDVSLFFVPASNANIFAALCIILVIPILLHFALAYEVEII